MDIPTLDDVDIEGETVGLRIDINSPIGDDGEIADTFRFDAHLETIEELLDHGARVAVMAHQGRPGGDDFTTLESHTAELDARLDQSVSYVDSTFSHDAREAIRSLDDGEAVCVENVRFYSEEYMSHDPDRAAATHLVERLSEVFTLYVNDAFACAHRAQPTIIGFPERIPSVAGRVMERELAILGDIESTPRPRIALLAGAKVTDSLDVATRLLSDELVDSVLAGGVLANVFFLAGGDDPGPATAEDVDLRGYTDELDRAANLLEMFGDRIVLPVDVAVADDGGRKELPVSAFPAGDGEVPRDLGVNTIEAWSSRLGEAGTVICNGPPGRFEEDRFTDATKALFAAVEGAACSIAGGGDTGAALRRFDIDAFDHVSTGGGASLAMLSGETLPGVEALRRCAIDQRTA